MKEILERINQQFNCSAHEHQPENLSWVQLDKKQLVPLLSYLKHTENFSHFVLLTAVDWIENNEFQLNYLLTNHELHQDIAIRVMIPRDEPEMITAHHLWQQIATYQREINEMYGINFPNSPRVNESFLLEGWEGIPPMRREFDTKKYSEETFFPRPRQEGKDPQTHMKQKLYPDEE
ncbi:MAG: NADH-quinone oxidoreductase subunit C [Bacteroidales bacterium]|jgi:NADH-quinone oxidoreductase subunit C|nr:NADH-quinone oxidoreductase subunit C [Bacteroidales bacterium]